MINIPLVLNGNVICDSVTSPSYTTVSTAYGICENSRVRMTWININMPTLLGNFYDEYSLFRISLAHYSTHSRIQTGSACFFKTSSYGDTVEFEKYKSLNIYIEGLPFINSTFNQQTNNYTNRGLLYTFNAGTINSGSLGFPKETYNYNYDDENDGLIFYNDKTRTNYNITISIGSAFYLTDVDPSQFTGNGRKYANSTIKLNISPILSSKIKK